MTDVDLERVVLTLRVEGIHAHDCSARNNSSLRIFVCTCWVETKALNIYNGGPAPKAGKS